MKSLKKVICLALAAVTVFGALAGCGKKEVKTNTGDLEPVTLKCYIVGDLDPNKDAVLENLNNKLKEKINATLDIIEIPWSDYKKKYSLILASGENIDLIYTSSWCYFYSEARKGAFMPLDEDMIKTYAPKTYEKLPKDAWDYVKIDGKISMIPQLKAGIAAKVMVYREDLRKKYNVPEIKSFEDFDAYFAAIKKNEPAMFPLNATVGNIENLFFTYMWEKEGYRPVHLTDALVTSADDSTNSVIPLYEAKSYKEWLNVAKDWNTKGYWSKDILSNKTSSDTAFLNGTSAATVCQYSSDIFSQSKMYAMHPDWEMGVYEFPHNGKLPVSSYTNNGMAIPSTSKNPERALMAYDLLAWDEDIYTAHCYGIEGKTYQVTADGYVKVPDGVDESKTYKFGGLGLRMGINNKKFNKEDPSFALEQYSKYILDSEADAKYGLNVPAAYIPYDVTPIANELTSLGNAHTSYNNLLITGMSKDSVDKQLEQYKKAAETAGISKILETVNKQKDEFLKSTK